MRIRSIRPEFWASEDVAALSWDARLVFIGLWSYVDDNGVGRDNPKLIAADLFPLEDDPRETVAKVSRALEELSTGGQVVRYEAAGKRFVHVVKFSVHQRVDHRSKDRYPLPTREDTTSSRQSRETVASDPEILGPGEGEKGRRGEGEKDSSSEIADAIPDQPREDVEMLCQRLADRVEANGSKRPTITKGWRDACRLMIDKDHRTPGQVARMIDWCQADEFWRANILSMPKLREKYDQLRLKAMEDAPKLSPDTDWFNR